MNLNVHRGSKKKETNSLLETNYKLSNACGKKYYFLLVDDQSGKMSYRCGSRLENFSVDNDAYLE